MRAQVEGLGIHSISSIFRDFGYVARDTLAFPAKKLTALWFAPPGYESRLPRIFVSELQARAFCRAPPYFEGATCDTLDAAGSSLHPAPEGPRPPACAAWHLPITDHGPRGNPPAGGCRRWGSCRPQHRRWSAGTPARWAAWPGATHP